MRQRFPHFGPKKVRACLIADEPAVCWPAASTIGAILEAEGLVVPNKRRRRPLAQGEITAGSDTPNGEWAVDFQDKRLFFYPPGPLADADILISDMESPIVEVRDAHHIEFRNITVEGTLGDGVRVVDCSEIALRGCTVRNVAKYGVVIERGSSNVVESCDLYALGAGGVGLSGGDTGSQPRVPAGHRVENCDIHHFGEIERVYAPGVNVGYRGGGGGSAKVDAVGMIVRHNAIHHCPHAGVLFNSFDNLFEYNEVFQFALVSNDMGAFYSYSKPGGIGNNTFRYNFMHSSPEGDGIYFDYVKLPAIVLLPAWIGNELLQLWLYPDSNINYMAHLGGLVTGAALAFAIKLLSG